MKKFIRIIGGDEYEDYLKCEDYKYIPKRLIYFIQRWINPRIICNYIYETDKTIVGYGVGVFLKRMDISKEEYKNKIIDSINDIKSQEEYSDIEYLVNENLKLNYDDLKDVEEKCNVKVASGKSLFVENILACIKDICKFKKQDISQKEVFIVSDDTKVTEQLVNEIAMTTKFIELFTQDLEFGRRLEEDMFNKYGLSLHATEDTEKVYSNYDFIINLNEKSQVDVSRISKNKILIDLSDGKVLNRDCDGKTKGAIIIDDLFFKNEKCVCSENGVGELDSLLGTSTSSLINRYTEITEKISCYKSTHNKKKKKNTFNLNKQDKSEFIKIDKR